jgi:predicted alpha/beta hydrolase
VGALGAKKAYARFAAPIRAYSITDDGYAPPRAVEAFLEFYPAATRKLERVDPAQVGGGPIGHFGFFRERFKDTLWKDAADWLEGR